MSTQVVTLLVTLLFASSTLAFDKETGNLICDQWTHNSQDAGRCKLVVMSCQGWKVHDQYQCRLARCVNYMLSYKGESPITKWKIRTGCTV